VSDQVALKPKTANDDKNLGLLAPGLGILGFVVAAAATGLSAWRQKFRGGGAL
jgi:hypothetical protein